MVSIACTHVYFWIHLYMTFVNKESHPKICKCCKCNKLPKLSWNCLIVHGLSTKFSFFMSHAGAWLCGHVDCYFRIYFLCVLILKYLVSCFAYLVCDSSTGNSCGAGGCSPRKKLYSWLYFQKNGLTIFCKYAVVVFSKGPWEREGWVSRGLSWAQASILLLPSCQGRSLPLL